MRRVDIAEEREPASERDAAINVIGQLVGFTADGATPLVIYPGQVGTAAMRAKSVIDIHGSHVGRSVLLAFDNGDRREPIILGCLRAAPVSDLARNTAGTVEVDADGERLVVTAKRQLVLRCGDASITLTAAGKVIIRGNYVLSHSRGANCVQGGTIHLN
jgi:hypothetical protein